MILVIATTRAARVGDEEPEVMALYTTINTAQYGGTCFHCGLDEMSLSSPVDGAV